MFRCRVDSKKAFIVVNIMICVEKSIIKLFYPGVTGVQVEEIYSLDQSLMAQLKPVHGLIFLFKWVPDDSPPAGTIVLDSRANSMFFAKQVTCSVVMSA
jgi:hypothetical protein